jgi:DNA end-binding protein Ku
MECIDMNRRPWKGVVGVGLPPAPVALCPETRQDDILLDNDGNDGDDGPDDDAAGTNEFQERRYVILPDKGSDASIVKSTHAVDIFAFVNAQEIPFRCFETPYLLAPVPGGEKVYALLCETLRRSRKIGIAHVVIQMRRQLAALVPRGQSLMLNPLRCENEAIPGTPPDTWFDQADDSGLNESELALARQLVDSMTEQWDVLLQTDRLHYGIDDLATAVATHALPPDAESTDIIDLEDVLEWIDAQEGGDSLDALVPRPHKSLAAPASRRSGVTRAAGGRSLRPRPRRTG